MSEKKRVGEVRPSQVMHTYGIGSIVDLPYFSAQVMGLQAWDPPTLETVVAEDRLLGMVRSHLGDQVDRLVKPPAKTDTGGKLNPFDPEYLRGIPVSTFPGWMRCPLCNLIAPIASSLFEFKHNPYKPDQSRYVHHNCPKTRAGTGPTVIPVRFVRGCEHGHLDDFPWVEFVHGGPTTCKWSLELLEFGVSAEAADIVVKCRTCGTSAPMSKAFGETGAGKLGPCTGKHHHIRHQIKKCDQPSKAMLTGASNIWFSLNVSALTIPGNEGKLARLVKENWPMMEQITSLEILDFARKTNPAMQVFSEWNDDVLWAAIEAERAGSAGKKDQKVGLAEMKAEEWNVFSNPEGYEHSETLQMKPALSPHGYDDVIEKVVLVERLREVSALIGFTRIISPGDFADLDEIENNRRVQLSRKTPDWVPASELFGEGLFIQLKESAIEAWSKSAGFDALETEFKEGHTSFRRARNIDNPSANFPGMRYILLHSLSHALIRQFAIECGYGSASLRERIYAADPHTMNGPMAGFLLYTAAPDSEGTLGGLVALGKPKTLNRHIDHALEEMRLCASDPLCSEHVANDDALSLHGASCHACLFAAETSCERSNKYLDRRVLIETIGNASVPFFSSSNNF
jgi:hypothetical protein